MHVRSTRALLLPLFAAAVGACASDGRSADAAATDSAPESAPATAVEVTVTSRDYAYEMPDTIPAGLTRFRLVNQGSEMHHAMLVRIGEGHSYEEFVTALQSDGPPPDWVEFLGGPNAPPPGENGALTAVNLEAGTYAVVCMIPSPDGKPHYGKGMVKQLVVVPSDAAPSEPEYDIRMVLDDYSFDHEPAIAAGRHTIRVENAAEQEHEVVIVRLAPGKTADDLVAWAMQPAGPPPAEPVGGTVGLSQGRVNYVTADFTPGTYALVCFIPDVSDGRPHVAHGMVRTITVS